MNPAHLPQRLLARHRRLLAAFFAGLSMLCLATAVRPAPETGVPVLVAAHDLRGGTVLSAEDLVVVEMSSRHAPPSALRSAESVVGKVLAAAVDRGVPVTSRSVVSQKLLEGTSGRVLTPVRFPDPDLAVVLSPGATVDVVGADEGGAATLARGAKVVALPTQPSEGGMFAAGGSNRGLLVILEVTPREAAELAQAQARGRLGITVH